MTINDHKITDLEHGWDYMQKGIIKLKKILEGLPEPQFSSEDYMMLYTYASFIPLLDQCFPFLFQSHCLLGRHCCLHCSDL